jgi:benzoyl-CoA 2,3-dioxygenase component B
MFSSLQFDPAGAPLSAEEWSRRKNEWLPSSGDREYLLSIMAEPVYEAGNFANYVAPPVRGINRMPINFQYVRTEA